jgi:hypothetical protein
MILEVFKNLVFYKWGFLYLGLILWLITSFFTTTRPTLVITSVVTGMLSGSLLVNNDKTSVCLLNGRQDYHK